MGFLDGLIGGVRRIFDGGGVEQPTQDAMQFIGADVVDDPTNKRTKITITATTAAGSGVAALANLRSVGPSDRADKQRRVLSNDPQGRTYPSGWAFKSGSGAGVSDDGINIAKPNDLAPSDPGRWFRDPPIYVANVKAFGAIGDGATDDSSAFTNALAALSPGGHLIVPQGTYLVSSITVSTSSITIEGSGESSVIRAKDLGVSPLFQIEADGIHIRSVFLQGVAVDGSTTQWGIDTDSVGANVFSSGATAGAITGGETLHLVVDGVADHTVTFQGGDTTIAKVIDRINTFFGPGGDYSFTALPHPSSATDLRLVSPTGGPSSTVQIVGGSAMGPLGLSAGTTAGTGTRSRKVTIENVHFGGQDSSHALNNGVRIGGGCDDWTVSQCLFELAGFDGAVGSGYGVLVGPSKRLKVVHSTMRGTSFGGRHFVYIGGGCNQATVTDNHVDHANSNSISMLSDFYQPPCIGNLISNNQLLNQATALGDSAAVSCTGNQRENSIIGNEIRDCGRVGVIASSLGFAPGGNADNVIGHNTIIRSGEAAIAVEGAYRTRIVDNMIHDASQNGGSAAISISSFSGSGTEADGIVVRRNVITNSGNPLYTSGILLSASSSPTGTEVVDNSIQPGTSSGSDGIVSWSTSTSTLVRRNLKSRPTAYVGGATTANVQGLEFIHIANASPTNLDQLTGEAPDQELLLFFEDGNTTVRNAVGGEGRINLRGAVNYNPPANSTLRLISQAGVWYEEARANEVIVNADVAAGAAIAGTKIAPDFGSQDVITTGTIHLGAATVAQSTGLVRVAAGSTVLAYRNGSNDRVAISTSGDSMTLGDSVTARMIASTGELDLYAGSTLALAIVSSAIEPQINAVSWAEANTPTISQTIATSQNAGRTMAITAQAAKVSGAGAGGDLQLAGGAGDGAGVAGFVSVAKLKSRDLGTGIAHISSVGVYSSSAIVNADVDGSAAIAYSKLALSNSIVNADVNSAAAIAGSKISPDFSAQTVTTTGTLHGGVVSIGAGTLPTTGDLRLQNGIAINYRGASTDLAFLATSGDSYTVGNTTTGKMVASAGELDFYAGATYAATVVVASADGRTGLFISRNVSGTASVQRVDFVDPGNAGANFTAGQKVLILAA